MEDNQIKEINKHISDAIEQWQDIMLTADADQWAYHLEYTKQDLKNALYIFNHVAQNMGIKNKTLDLLNIEAVGSQLREVVKTLTGYDTTQMFETDKTVS